MKHFLLNALNQNFRPPRQVVAELFPLHEFDESEALKLKCLCNTIRARGYDYLFEEKESSHTRDILDLAAGYGCFVSKEATPWYLGIFIAAECLMEPYSHESFCDQMLHSEVLAAAPSEWQTLALWLMLTALFCDRLDTTSARVELFINSCSGFGYHLEALPIEDVCKLRQMEMRDASSG